MKESPLLAKLFKNYVLERPTRGVRTDLEIPKAKKKGSLFLQCDGCTILSPRNSNLPSYSSFSREVRRHLLNLGGQIFVCLFCAVETFCYSDILFPFIILRK